MQWIGLLGDARYRPAGEAGRTGRLIKQPEPILRWRLFSFHRIPGWWNPGSLPLLPDSPVETSTPPLCFFQERRRARTSTSALPVILYHNPPAPQTPKQEEQLRQSPRTAPLLWICCLAYCQSRFKTSFISSSTKAKQGEIGQGVRYIHPKIV